MAFVDFIPASWRLRMARGLIKAAAYPIVPEWVTASFIQPTWRVLVAEGYKANGAVYACLCTLAMGFSEPKLIVQDTQGQSIPNHPLQKLLDRPNDLMSQSEFASYIITWLALGGNVYIHKVRDKTGRVVELWPYHAGNVSPVPGQTRWIDHYDYDKGNGRPVAIPIEDMIHIKWPLPDPDQPWMATPPLLHAAREVDTDNEATRYLFALLKNDALPRTVIEMPPEWQDDNKGSKTKRIKAQFRDRYGGAKRGEVGILTGGAKMSRIALDLQQLAFEALRRVPEARIAAAFRVPAVIAGLSVGLERSTFANYAEAERQFTEGTKVPLWRMVADELTQSLGSEFGAPVRVAYDLSGVRSLQENETERWQRAQVGVLGGWLLVNEARRYAGLDDVPGGNVFLRGMATLAEPSGAKAFVAVPLEVKRGIRAIEDKAQRAEASKRIGETLLALRKAAAMNMETEAEKYFKALSDRVVNRAMTWGKSAKELGTKALPSVDDLLTPKDDEELAALLKRFYADLLHVSWGVWDIALGTQIAFDLTDPMITKLMEDAGLRIKEISETTLSEVRDLLKRGNESGWSIDHLVRGDPKTGVRGLRDIVEETYKDRARTIARTELGTMQQRASIERYGSGGVKEVLVLDDGFPNSDENCVWIAGQVRSLEWTKSDHPGEGPTGIKNPLQHPNCVRCYAPYFGDW